MQVAVVHGESALRHWRRCVVAALAAGLLFLYGVSWSHAASQPAASRPADVLAGAIGLIAAYDGGQVTAADVYEALDAHVHPLAASRPAASGTGTAATQPASGEVSTVEQAARFVAATRLLLERAHAADLDGTAEWQWVTKLGRQQLLADALCERNASSIHPADGPPQLVQAVQSVLKSAGRSQRRDLLKSVAAQSFPLTSIDSASQPADADVVLRCGQLEVTRVELNAAARMLGVAEQDSNVLITRVTRQYGDAIQLGELARSLAVGERGKEAKLLKLRLEGQLAVLVRPSLALDYGLAPEQLAVVDDVLLERKHFVMLAVTSRTAETANLSHTPQTDPVLASFKGGEVRASEFNARLQKMLNSRAGIPTYANYAEMCDEVIRDSAVRQLLLEKAAAMELRKRADFVVFSRICETTALADVLQDRIWASLTADDKEIRAWLHDHPNPRKLDDAAGALPTDEQFVSWMLRQERLSEQMETLTHKAVEEFPVTCRLDSASTSAQDAAQGGSSGPDDAAVAFECGTQAFTVQDLRTLWAEWTPQLTSCRDADAFQGQYGEDLSLGEYARGQGLRSDPHYAEAMQAREEAWLVEQARQAFIQEGSEHYASDQRVAEYYDKDFTAEQDAVVKYDAIVVVPNIPAGASETQRQTAMAAARKTAESLIQQVRQGTSFDDLVKRHPECRHAPASFAVLSPVLSFSQVLADVPTGGVAAQPIEDHGGFCVPRVLESVPKRKMPLEQARAYIVDELKFQYRRQPASYFDSQLLDTHGFTFHRGVLPTGGQKGGTP